MSKKNRSGNLDNNQAIQSTGSLKLFLIITAVIVGFFVFFMSSGGGSGVSEDSAPVQAEIDQATGKQIINLTAKGGYKPGSILAKSGIANILHVATTNTFDCSLALRVPSLGISKNLPTTGLTDIEIPAQPAGSTLNGTCAMGMYWFSIKFT